LPQSGAEPLRKFFNNRSDCTVGVSIAERLFSILQNNPDGKAFFFI
jgi:hypothetical protein